MAVTTNFTERKELVKRYLQATKSTEARELHQNVLFSRPESARRLRPQSARSVGAGEDNAGLEGDTGRIYVPKPPGPPPPNARRSSLPGQRSSSAAPRTRRPSSAVPSQRNDMVSPQGVGASSSNSWVPPSRQVLVQPRHVVDVTAQPNVEHRREYIPPSRTVFKRTVIPSESIEQRSTSKSQKPATVALSSGSDVRVQIAVAPPAGHAIHTTRPQSSRARVESADAKVIATEADKVSSSPGLKVEAVASSSHPHRQRPPAPPPPRPYQPPPPQEGPTPAQVQQHQSQKQRQLSVESMMERIFQQKYGQQWSAAGAAAIPAPVIAKRPASASSAQRRSPSVGLDNHVTPGAGGGLYAKLFRKKAGHTGGLAIYASGGAVAPISSTPTAARSQQSGPVPFVRPFSADPHKRAHQGPQHPIQAHKITAKVATDDYKELKPQDTVSTVGSLTLLTNPSLDSAGDIPAALTTASLAHCQPHERQYLLQLLRRSCAQQSSGRGSLEFYHMGSMLGEGSFAQVRSAWHKLTGQSVAVKTYERAKITDPQQWKRIEQEVRLMERLNHPRVIRLFEAVESPKRTHLIMEVCSGGNLCTYVKRRRRLEEVEARRVLDQILQGVEYLHSQDIVHRDIKLENVLLDESRNVKLVDFGFSACVTHNRTLHVFCGTPSYMAPEIIRRVEYAGKPVDVWSLGIVLYALLCGCFPFSGATYPELYKRIVKGQYRTPEWLSSSAADLIASMLVTDPLRRCSLAQIRAHPFMQMFKSSKPRSEASDCRRHSFHISQNPGQDVHEESLKLLGNFGVEREEMINQIMHKRHSCLMTTYYLLKQSLEHDKGGNAAQTQTTMPQQ